MPANGWLFWVSLSKSVYVYTRRNSRDEISFERSLYEDTKHVLEECSKSRRERLVMYHNLHRLGILTINTKVLLGGGVFDLNTQQEIRKAVKYFLSSSGTIDKI